MRTAVTFAWVALLFVSPASGAVFQYSATCQTEQGDRTAFLWVPPDAEQVRGIVMAGMTLMEQHMVRDTLIRRACADQQLAIVFLKCGLGAVDVQQVLDDFAQRSGYRELSIAPLLFVGHSAGGPPAKALAIAMRERCFGVVQYRGGVPGGDPSVPPGIPALMMTGQFDEFGGVMRDGDGRETWEAGRDAMLAFRSGHEAHLGSIVVEPGAGHFAWSDRNAAYLAMFIRKAARARIPAAWPLDSRQPVELLEIDPASGWLTDLTINDPASQPPASYAEYEGDRAQAAWHFDRELAEATRAYHAGGFGKRDQFIKWNDPFWVDAGTRFFFTQLAWTGDGQTIEVHPVYAEAYPEQYSGCGPRWLEAGQAVGHSSAPIRVRPVGGPVVATGANRLRIEFDNLAGAGDGARVTFLAFSPGDDRFRYTEHVGMMPRGFKGLTKGRVQTISFPTVGDLKSGSGPVAMIATSDSGLPVEYYVAYGPARIEAGKLRIAELPQRAKFPIEVKVVAYQFGRGIEPLVQTAEPIEQTLRIEK